MLALLADRGATLSVAETLTGGQVAARLAALPDAERVFRRGTVACSGSDLAAALYENESLPDGTPTADLAALRGPSGAAARRRHVRAGDSGGHADRR